MKRLVVCFDGTWNKAGDDGDPGDAPTNVARFHDAVLDRAGDGVEQAKTYIAGVGTRWYER
ncbi:MAG: DUF2235 domain-containing protein, partial [Candidatus Rokubacteria bacterium]|nr:DUF2235 domain-containing protein [Candidatus Rokubacteria bacterium]